MNSCDVFSLHRFGITGCACFRKRYDRDRCKVLRTNSEGSVSHACTDAQVFSAGRSAEKVTPSWSISGSSEPCLQPVTWHSAEAAHHFKGLNHAFRLSRVVLLSPCCLLIGYSARALVVLISIARSPPVLPSCTVVQLHMWTLGTILMVMGWHKLTIASPIGSERQAPHRHTSSKKLLV